ncbi:MAG: terpene cyclase/mutase family protein [Planctomycetes bacterium]|nr:terpene cyclase/mutase family protein [Planctomycetota bacterium]
MRRSRHLVDIIAVAMLCIVAAGLTVAVVRADDKAPAEQPAAPKGPLGDDPISGEELSPEVLAAVDRGLTYLANAQNEDGGFGRTGGYSSHAGITGLAGLAFMSQGSLPDRGKYGKNVQKCLEFITAHTGRSGFISGGGVSHGPMYGHGFATLFLAEVYGMSPDPVVREKLSRAVDLIVRTQNDEGGWRYQPIKYDADLSVTICSIMALRAARNNGIKVPKATVDRAIDYVKKSQNPDGGFSYTLNSRGSAFPRSAAGVCSLYNCGIYSGPEIDNGLAYLLKNKPGTGGQGNAGGFYFYGNYYATQAMFIAGGEYWRQWWPAISKDLVTKQSDNDGSWTGQAGKEYGTAMACIILQIPNRYLPILQR